MRVPLLLALLAVPLLAPPAAAGPPDYSWYCVGGVACADWGNEGSGSWCIAVAVVLVAYHTQKQCVLDPVVVPP